MSICLKCKTELQENAKFCSECGAKVPRSVMCPYCKKRVNVGFEFCPYCGMEMANAVPQTKHHKPLFNIDRKIIKIGSSAVAALLVLVLLASFILNAVSKDSYLFYIKHEELFSANKQNLKSWQISEYFADSVEVDNQKMKNYASYFSKHVNISEDKKNIFYLDRLESMNQYSLYHRKANGNKESNKIAKNVTMFDISNKGDCVSYLRGDGALYWHDLEERKKLASDVTTFYMSEDGKTFLYLTQDGDAYYHIIGEEKQKIDSEMTSFSYVSDDLNTVYYLKTTDLYKKAMGKEPVLLSSDVKQFVKAYETGEIYYLKGADVVVNLQDYLEDDMLEEDASLQNPVMPTAPLLSDYETQEKYQAAYAEYTKAMEVYQQTMTKYLYKTERENLRNSGLEGRTVTIPENQLCYFDGKKEQVLAERVISYKNYAEENAAVIYSTYSDSEVRKVKFSEIQSSYNVENMVREAFTSSCNFYVSVKGKSSEIKQPGAYIFAINAQADCIYILAEKAEEPGEETAVETNNMSRFDLYQIKISGQKLGKLKKIDSNVYSIINLMDNNHYVYYKKVDEQKQSGDLYMDGKKLESDVRLNTVKFDKNTENLCYMVDWEDKDQYGTLKKYNGDKIVKVSDEVYSYEILPTGEVLYLYDYSIDSYEGELYIYRKNKSRKVDGDVVAIIPVQEKQ